jgi:hypothetical protein
VEDGLRFETWRWRPGDAWPPRHSAAVLARASGLRFRNCLVVQLRVADPTLKRVKCHPRMGAAQPNKKKSVGLPCIILIARLLEATPIVSLRILTPFFECPIRSGDSGTPPPRGPSQQRHNRENDASRSQER